MTRALQHVEVGEDEPVTLAEACRLFFGSRLSPSALRTEAAKGNLEIIQIARKDFVTKRAISDMVDKSRRPANPLDSGPAQKPAAEQASLQSPGASRMVQSLSAQDALRIRLRKHSENSRTTSPANTSRSAAVVPLKSQ